VNNKNVKNAENAKNKNAGNVKKPECVCGLKVMHARNVNGNTPGPSGEKLTSAGDIKNASNEKRMAFREMTSVVGMSGNALEINALKIGNMLPGAKVSHQAHVITRLPQRPGENNANSLLHGITFKSLSVGKKLRIQGRGVTSATMKKGGPERKNRMQQPTRQGHGRANCEQTWKAGGRGHLPP